MSVASNTVKQTAKDTLKGNIPKLFTAGLILSFTWILCVNFAGLLGLVTGEIFSLILSALMLIFICIPLGLGVLRYIWRMLSSVSDSPLEVFYWFTEKGLYIKALKITMQLCLRITLWLAVLNIPSLLLYSLSKSFLFELMGTATPVWTGGLGYFSVFFRNLSIVFVFFIMLKYYLAPMLLIVDENMDINEAMYRSSVISRKSSIDFIGLIFSSFGWILLTLFVLPMPFTLPLLLSYYAVHTRFAVEEYNRHIEESREISEGFI